jgi:hypothetical protein
MNKKCSMRKEPLHCCLQIWNLERKPDLSANPLCRFQFVNGACLRFVEQLQCGFAHIQDQCTTLAIVPESGRFKTKPITIELDQPLIVTRGYCNAQF